MIRPLSRHKAVTRVGFIVSALVLLTSVGLPAIRAYAAATATVIAGMPSDGPLVNEIAATSAQFWNPSGVAVTSDGTIYVSDTNHNEIRSITADGIIHAAFGNGVAGCETTDTFQTQLYNPNSIVRDDHDNIYVSTGCGQIVEFTPGNSTGTVIAGHFDGTANAYPPAQNGSSAKLVAILPSKLAYDQTSGGLYFYDGRTRQILELNSGVLSVITSNATQGFSGDGGPAISAQFFNVGGLLAANGNLYISDSGNCRVRVITADGNIATIAGDGNCNDLNDTGPATAASMQYPGALTMDSNGVLYIGGSQSGSIFAYDTGTQNLTPIIAIYASTAGLTMDNNGDLLALHTGVNQQLYRVTGLPSVTPPPDGKQHGRVTNVSWTVKPTTPLWNMEVAVTTDKVSCPAVVAVKVGTWQKRATVCGLGETAPATTNFNWKVFNTTHSLQPDSTQNVTAFVVQSDATKYGTPDTTLKVPGKPALIGVGDSYLSGWHQEQTVNPCKRLDGTPSTDTACDLYSNDYNYSWVTRLDATLNTKAPTEWQFDYTPTYLLAHGGDTSSDIVQTQMAPMQTLLAAHPKTWNVVVFDGGANDLNLAGTLSAYYQQHSFFSAPWNEKNLANCPNSQQMYDTLTSGPTPKSNVIANNMKQVVAAAQQATTGTRLVNVLYPYITNIKASEINTNVCVYGDGAQWHGSKQVIEALDNVTNIAQQLPGNDIATLDLRDTFGNTPMNLIQQTVYYGYPHPNNDGQTKIAKKAFAALKQ